MSTTCTRRRARAAAPFLLATLLARTAWAAPPAEALAAALESTPSTPDVALACAPAGVVLGVLAQLAAGSAGASESDRALMAALYGSAGLSALGVDVDDALVLTIWDPTGDPVGELDIPFRAGPADASALLEQLAMHPVEVPDAPGSWMATDGDTRLHVRLVEDHLALSYNGSPPEHNALPHVDADLVSGLPAGAGCAVWAAASREELHTAGELVFDGGLALAGFLPFDGDGIALLRVRAPVDLPAALTTSGRAPVTGSSLQPPSAVFSLGLSMADLLDDTGVVDRLDLKPGQVRRLQRYANIGSGSTVALFDDPRAGDFVAVLPLDGARGPTRAHRVTRRMRRLARKAGLDVLHSDDRSLVVAAGERMVFVEVRDSRIYLAAHASRALEAAEGQGDPWVGSDDLVWALQWPIAAWSGPAGVNLSQFSLGIRGGLRAVDDIVELGMRVETDAPPGFLGKMVTTLISMKLAEQERKRSRPGGGAGEDGGGSDQPAPTPGGTSPPSPPPGDQGRGPRP